MGRTKPSNKLASKQQQRPHPKKSNGSGKGPRTGGKKTPLSGGVAKGTDADPKKAHRWRPGTVALREIRHFQKSIEPQLKFRPFVRVVREIASMLTDDIRFKGSALEALRCAAEAEIVNAMELAQEEALHGKRITIMPKDMQIARRVSAKSLGRPVGFGVPMAYAAPPPKPAAYSRPTKGSAHQGGKAPRYLAPVAPRVAPESGIKTPSERENSGDEEEREQGATKSKDTEPVNMNIFED